MKKKYKTQKQQKKTLSPLFYYLKKTIKILIIMQVFIDNREKDIINKLFEESISFETKNLDIGDIQIVFDNRPVIIIERKTLKDLSASIKDGRYKEQKIRLNVCGLDKHNIVFLIEGKLNNYGGKYLLPKSTLLSSMVNTLFRDGFSVFKTQDLNETCLFLKKIIKTAQDKPENLKKKQLVEDYTTVIKTQKKKNLTPSNCFYAQLIQIPGISKQMAKFILNKHENMINLCNYYHNTEPEQRITLFKDEVIETSTGKKRKIGKVASSNLFNYLYCN